MKLTDIQNNELVNNLSDAKIHSIYFNFDADNPIQPQDLVISVSKLNADLDRQQLIFHNTSSFYCKNPSWRAVYKPSLLLWRQPIYPVYFL